MSVELRYGDKATLRMNVPVESIVADLSLPRGTPLDDPAAAVAAAVANPLEFPPLQDATFPGDQIAIAVDRGVPQMPAVVSAVVHALMEGGAEPKDIEIVLAAGEDGDATDPTEALPPTARGEVRVSVHASDDKDCLAYLAASKEGQPIYFNRAISDADVVLPISTLRLDESLGYAGVYSGLYPTFSDSQTQQRFRAPSTADWSAHRRRRREEAAEAAWLLGVQFTVQITPGAGSSLLHVLAGDANAVAERGRKLCAAAWLHELPARASLVVAAIEGGAEHQTWENFGRALFSAAQAVSDGGAIVLCTNLRCRPGPALQRLNGTHDFESLLHELRRDRSSDATSAALLAEVRERVHVYLLSDLDGSVVEDLGVGCVHSSEEVERLTRQHESCIFLGNAQHAVLTADA